MTILQMTNNPAQNRQSLDTEKLRQRLKLQSFNSELSLRKKHPLADEFFQKKGLRPGKIREHAAKLLSSGALAGTLLLSPSPAVPLPPMTNPSFATQNISLDSPVFLQLKTALDIKTLLPPVGQWKLTSDQEERISRMIWEVYGIKAKPELDGNQLNFNYGRMGAEQHLPRFPGDTVEQHGSFLDKGITSGLGGWGYFARSKETLTPPLEEAEKYYVAVPIMYLPDWSERVRYYVEWFKYRRVVVVNPANGKVVVADVADAGPADWTGKHFGGSPEVMAYLGINQGMQNYPVVLFFLDDPNKEIPLGPLEYNIEKNRQQLVNKS